MFRGFGERREGGAELLFLAGEMFDVGHCFNEDAGLGGRDLRGLAAGFWVSYLATIRGVSRGDARRELQMVNIYLRLQKYGVCFEVWLMQTGLQI